MSKKDQDLFIAGVFIGMCLGIMLISALYHYLRHA